MSDPRADELSRLLSVLPDGFNGYAAADPSGGENIAHAALVHERVRAAFEKGENLSQISQGDLEITLFFEGREFRSRGWGPEGNDELVFPRALSNELLRRR